MVPRVSILPDPVADPWPTLWTSFERSMRADDASRFTLSAYGDAADLFYGFLRERNWPTDPAHLEKRHVEDFLIWLRVERQAKPATVRARFSTLRRFFNWCIEEGEIEHSPMARMHGPKVEEPPPPVLSEDEQQRLLAACKGNEFEDRRDMALLRLMLDAGIRRGEVAGIKLEDLDLDHRVIKILGKGNRPGLAYFGVKTERDLDRYLRVRTSHPRRELLDLWLAQKGALTGDGIHYLIGRRARLAGIDRPIHPHLTRHTWAHTLKAGGASDEDVMTLGHWKDPKVMARYGSSAAMARAQETHRRLSPGDRI
jgi:site-specific recombinase XerD